MGFFTSIKNKIFSNDEILVTNLNNPIVKKSRRSDIDPIPQSDFTFRGKGNTSGTIRISHDEERGELKHIYVSISLMEGKLPTEAVEQAKTLTQQIQKTLLLPNNTIKFDPSNDRSFYTITIPKPVSAGDMIAVLGQAVHNGRIDNVDGSYREKVNFYGKTVPRPATFEEFMRAQFNELKKKQPQWDAIKDKEAKAASKDEIANGMSALRHEVGEAIERSYVSDAMTSQEVTRHALTAFSHSLEEAIEQAGKTNPHTAAMFRSVKIMADHSLQILESADQNSRLKPNEMAKRMLLQQVEHAADIRLCERLGMNVSSNAERPMSRDWLTSVLSGKDADNPHAQEASALLLDVLDAAANRAGDIAYERDCVKTVKLNKEAVTRKLKTTVFRSEEPPERGMARG